MFLDYTVGIVRILRPDGSTAGAGFLVSDAGLVVTCAHVIQDVSSQEEGEPKPDKVAIVLHATGEKKEASLVPNLWRPWNAEDVAFLRVEQGVPGHVNPLPLGTSKSTSGHHFDTLGFPVLSPQEGIRADGHILGEVTVRGCRVLQISSQQVTPGFSGAPVWDQVNRRVVGLVTKVAAPDAYGKMQETAFVTPSETLREVCRELLIADTCPYRGLLAFTEKEADFFFGRETLIHELTEHLRRNPRFLAVIGSSGSGKSSVVRAGLFTHLKDVPGLDASRLLIFRPGAAPHASIRSAWRTAGFAINESEDLFKTVAQRLQGQWNSGRLLLFGDQFEELFALSSESERSLFLRSLSELLESALPVTLVLTLRADFYEPFLRSPLGRYLQTGQLIVLPMASDEVRAAITGPAQAIGLRFDEGLVDRILEDTLEAENALPLLEFALTQLWAQRQDGCLTHDAYKTIGGVAGALGMWASDAYQVLTLQERAWARRIFTSLVHYGKDGAPDTRRRLPLRDVLTAAEDQDGVQRVIMHLASHRLLITDRDPQSGSYVEIIHDALLSEWEQFRAWIREDHPFFAWRQSLDERMWEWEENKRDEGALLRGILLADAQDRLLKRSSDLSPAEREYILISQQQQVEKEREAKLGREENLRQRRTSVAHELAAQAELIRNQSPDLIERSVLLAVESMRLSRSLEADQALRRGLALLPRPIMRMIHEGEVRDVVFSLDGRLVATASMDCTARVWDADTGRELARMTHESGVNSVEFSPDRKLLATASMDCTALWEATSGREVLRLAHDHQVYAVNFSLDGRLLATASMDRTARVWEADSGRELKRLVHEDQVYGVKFSPDGRTIATASWDGTARLWEVASGRELARMTHEDRVYAIVFTNDGKLVATASGDHTARLWEANGGREIARLNHENEVTDVVISPDGRSVATASWDRTARIWEVGSGRELARMTHEGNVYALAITPDGKLLATAGIDRTARVFEATSGRELARLTHEDRVYAIAFAQEGKLVATASGDCTARVWGAAKGRELASITHEDGVYAAVFSLDGRLVATASMDCTARVWDADTGRELARMTHESGVNSVEFSPDRKLLATASMDCTARVWEATSGREVLRLAHDHQVYAVNFSLDGRLLATASMDRTARVWEADSGRELKRLVHEDQVYGVKFSPDGRTIATASWDGTARLWEVASGRELAHMTHKDAVYAVVFSSDGKYLATASIDRTAAVWEAISGRELVRLRHEDQVHAVKFSPDGRTIATASWDRTARIWEVASGRELVRISHEHQVCAVDFSPDGEFLATASWDRTARVWEATSGREIVRLTHNERIYAAVFSPDGRSIVTASSDCTAHLWFWQPEDLIAEACARLTRNLTLDEWRQYRGAEPYRRTCPNLP